MVLINFERLWSDMTWILFFGAPKQDDISGLAVAMLQRTKPPLIGWEATDYSML
jgi:hypothetical protein